GEARVDAEDRPRLLLVMVEPVPELALPGALHIMEHEHGLEPDPLDVGHRPAVGREARPDRAARAADEGRRPAGVTVEPPDRVDPGVRVAVVLEPAAGRHVLAVVEVPAVRRDLRLARVLLPVPALRELEPVPAPDVPHPHLARAERARIPVVF